MITRRYLQYETGQVYKTFPSGRFVKSLGCVSTSLTTAAPPNLDYYPGDTKDNSQYRPPQDYEKVPRVVHQKVLVPKIVEHQPDYEIRNEDD